jgi:hypothetical protein
MDLRVCSTMAARNLPLTSNVVRFGWIVMLYRVGRTKVGSRTLFHGNTSPLVASGTGGPVELDSTSCAKSSGFSPAQGHSARIKCIR